MGIKRGEDNAKFIKRKWIIETKRIKFTTKIEKL